MNFQLQPCYEKMEMKICCLLIKCGQFVLKIIEENSEMNMYYFCCFVRQVQAYPCSVPGLPFDTEGEFCQSCIGSSLSCPIGGLSGMMDITDDDLLSSDPFGTGLDDIHIMGIRYLKHKANIDIQFNAFV